MRLAWALAALLALAAAPPPPDDVYVLRNGDRITGKTVLKGKNALALQTSYGRLSIPRSKIERILWGDGHEEILNPPPPAPPAPPPPVRLVLIITGKSFWHAWAPPEGMKIDPTLRLEATLDEEATVTYVDSKPDPNSDIPGALVNAFTFRPEDVTMMPAEGVSAAPPETHPGRIVLKIELPAARAGRRRLRLAYQTNGGTEAEPAWRGVAETSLDVGLRSDAPTFVEVHQDRGQMEFAGAFLGKRRMKHVDTFRVEAHAVGSAEPSPEPPSPPPLDTQPHGT